jgi:hypothetical protein
MGRAFEHKAKRFQASVFLLELTVRLGASQQGLTMLAVWDGFDHELIPLFSLISFQTLFILKDFEVRSMLLMGLGLAELRLRETRWFITARKWKYWKLP